ncbi:MAG: amino acid permease [Euryarchaeota archaeon]|nr:amino acid permease [Euryarchaeota archaeon]
MVIVDDGKLRQDLGLFEAVTLIMGSMIGSGIFILPAVIAAGVQSAQLVLLLWIVCGLLTITGALTFAEMAGMFPRAGGQYIYLREAFGKKGAYLYGWTMFWVIQTGIIAAVAVAFSLFTAVFFPMPSWAQKFVAVGCIMFLTIVNYLGVKYGGIVQNVFTVIKTGAIVALVVGGLLLGRASPDAYNTFLPASLGGIDLVSAFGIAMVAALFAYDGWPSATQVASEIKDPQKNVPRALVIGTAAVMLVYVAANAVYFYLLPLAQASASPRIAADAAQAFLGENGRLAISAAIMLSTFGTVNAFILASPRVYYAWAKDGGFIGSMASVHKKHGTPWYALMLQAIWASLLVLTGTYVALATMVVFAIWLFYIPSVVAYFKFRRKMPDAHRPYRTSGYPVVPLVFAGSALFICANFLLRGGSANVFGYVVPIAPATLVLIASGLPVLWMVRHKLVDEANPMMAAPSVVEGTTPPASEPSTVTALDADEMPVRVRIRGS